MARRSRSDRNSSSNSTTTTAESEATPFTLASASETLQAYWLRFLTRWRNLSVQYRIGAIVFVLLVLFLFVDDLQATKRSKLRQQQQSAATTSAWRQHLTWRNKGDDAAESFVTLVPGELPGYTGWARPATTLAKFFQMEGNVNVPAMAGKPWEITVRCTGADDCADGGALFYVRAYGPSVIVGQVQDNKDGSYLITLLPKDPGPYTVEVVLTFSNPPHMGQFPLPSSYPEPGYEGYLLPGFPLPLLVKAGRYYDKGTSRENYKTLPVCGMQNLFETSTTSAWEKARWVVTDKINQPNHVDDHHYKDQISFEGYEVEQNSLGIFMEYQHDTCRVLPHSAPQHPQNPLNQCANDKGPLHFIFVGDSNMRLQRNLFESLFLGLPEDQREKTRYNDHMIRASYMDLTGGALRCNLIGGNDKNVTRFFQTILARQDKTLEKPERYVVMFNTGMHDVHRLCSKEFLEDRVSYLGAAATDASKGFHCGVPYRTAIEGLATEILNFPADLRVFQSTTAGWPKYGNYGVVWPPDGVQNMPVATEFIEYFNEIAYQVIKDSFPTIPVMDGYWISVARPDNREVSLGRKKATEKKLSHPGIEVVSAILRQWITIVTQSDLCQDE